MCFFIFSWFFDSHLNEASMSESTLIIFHQTVNGIELLFSEHSIEAQDSKHDSLFTML